jgi:hypothetical protein
LTFFDFDDDFGSSLEEACGRWEAVLEFDAGANGERSADAFDSAPLVDLLTLVEILGARVFRFESRSTSSCMSFDIIGIKVPALDNKYKNKITGQFYF